MTVLLYIISVLASSLSQYWQKRAAMYFEENPELSAISKLLSFPMILGIGFLSTSALTWLGVLTQWDVSVAYPLLSVNFVIMLLVSKFAFGEIIVPKQWLGVMMIMVGVGILGGAH
ncbi:polymyxin resistance protein PmrL sucrose-6 phosphate hydrolase [Vibrio variabilis]|uniref:Polymyxin resistance protein PmrL sucrose-6 phosphate hydrolase n=1 Tax=Vibrio variabilis TaxID=990271 RepID=A0ABQ0J9Z8_9VIBR|nr:polymyxin resistance protein PmrL sucrose-6 phosphate hydrolase [Vibrio variabilis]